MFLFFVLLRGIVYLCFYFAFFVLLVKELLEFFVDLFGGIETLGFVFVRGIIDLNLEGCSRLEGSKVLGGIIRRG